VTVITSGGRVVTVTTAAGVVTLVVVVFDAVEVTVLVLVTTSVVWGIAAVIVVISEHEGADVDSLDAIVDGGGKGVAVIVMTTVEGVSYAVTTIVDSNVDNCVSVTGGRVDAVSVTVVAAAPPVEPPSTGTTE
jgi:hypothetical protein